MFKFLAKFFEGWIDIEGAYNQCDRAVSQLQEYKENPERFTGDKKESFLLDKPSVGLIIYPMVWAEQYYLKNNTILTVICDQKFDENDYIRNYQKYLSLI